MPHILSLSHILVGSYAVYPCHGTRLTGWIEVCTLDRYTPEKKRFGVYMIIKSSRSECLPFLQIFLSNNSHFVPISLSLGEEKDQKYTVYPPELDHVPLCVVEKRSVYRLHGNGYSPRVLPCT